MTQGRIREKAREQLLAIFTMNEVRFLESLKSLNPELSQGQIDLEMKSFREMNQRRLELHLTHIDDQEFSVLARLLNRPKPGRRSSSA